MVLPRSASSGQQKTPQAEAVRGRRADSSAGQRGPGRSSRTGLTTARYRVVPASWRTGLRARRSLIAVSASTVLGVLLISVGAALLAVGLLGWRERLPRNRFADVRTPATLRSEAAFTLANRVAAPPVLAAGAVAVATGALAMGTGGAMLTVIVAVGGAGALALVTAAGLLGHRAALAAAPQPTGCSGCSCGGGGCGAT